MALGTGALHLLLRRRTAGAATLYGLAVHFKLYPIIYAPALALFINHRYCGTPHRPWHSPAELFNVRSQAFRTPGVSWAGKTVFGRRCHCLLALGSGLRLVGTASSRR